jgi:hypothetical protein
LQSGDHVELRPRTPFDIQNGIQARTTASTEYNKDKRTLKPGTASPDWLAIQRDREQFVNWFPGEFMQVAREDVSMMDEIGTELGTDHKARMMRGPLGVI